MSASGLYGDVRACAGIVGHADLKLGDAVREVLEAHIAAGGGRFRGIRQSASWDADADVLGPLSRNQAGLYRPGRLPRRASPSWPRLASPSTPGCWSRSFPT